ncbi:MAG: glycine--tRNA ligase subunit beta, partial [Elusimicrobiota bacterium]|nr:glycine--tRNA ligase subunit beta [Elusimicrobiota bacterium]
MEQAMNFLLEIGTEELPFSAQRIILNESQTIFEKLLENSKISFKNIKIFVTPCRITVLAENIDNEKNNSKIEILGPPKKIAYSNNGEPTKALLGFLKKNDATIKDIIEKNTTRGTYLAIYKKYVNVDIDEILGNICLEFVKSLPFSKMMSWNSRNFKFIRPIRWVLCLLNDKIIDCDIAELKPSKITYSIGGYKSNIIEVNDIDSYFKNLEEKNIILDYNRRKSVIMEQITDIIKEYELISNDNDLLDEVTALVEKPTAILCEFDEKFLELPFEVIYTVMKNHQKCFALKDKNNKLIAKFVGICNGNNKDLKLIQAGYEKVALARLNDADFFFNLDKKLGIKNKTIELKNLVYQDKLGSVYDKLGRIKKIVIFFYEIYNKESFFKDLKIETINTIIELSKNDLLTDMVKEFPELQGIMGKYYAFFDGYDDAISNAIEEHYCPRFSGDKLPSTVYSAIVSIADKLDNIFSAFLLDKKPNGSKDPFGIRRQINGIFNILLDKKWDFDFIFENSQNEKNTILYLLMNIFLEKPKYEFDEKFLKNIENELEDFFKIRLENWLLERAENFKIDIVRAVIKSSPINPFLDYKKCLFLTECIADSSFSQVVNLYKRANNIIKQAISKNENIKFSDTDELKIDLFKLEIEKKLYDEINKCFELYNKNNIQWLKNHKYLNLKDILDNFFENVMIMDKDETIRKNRL